MVTVKQLRDVAALYWWLGLGILVAFGRRHNS